MQLHHDAHTKSQIKEVLYKYLYDPVNLEYKRKLDQVIRRNCNLIGSAYESFSFKGVTYATANSPLPKKANRLHKDLQEPFKVLLEEIRILNEYEVPQVLGLITRILNSSNNLQDYMKLFPPSIHAPLLQTIRTCPCRLDELEAEKVAKFHSDQAVPLGLLKKRLVLNLIS
jgi:hypothetical protein